MATGERSGAATAAAAERRDGHGLQLSTLKNNDTSENAGDGIFVDATSQHTVIDGNYAQNNTDDGIDVENATTTIINTATYYSRDLAIEAVPGVTASNNIAVGSGNPLGSQRRLHLKHLLLAALRVRDRRSHERSHRSWRSRLENWSRARLWPRP